MGGDRLDRRTIELEESARTVRSAGTMAMTGFNPERVGGHLVRWLRGQAEQAGARGAVVGISGGVDSATVAALCQLAFPDSTLGVLMPCHSAPPDLEDARAVCRALNLPHTVVVLDPVYDALLAALRTSDEFAEHHMALANLKPRLRMATLYFFANRLNRLVAGTGNRSEGHVGYFTKYGDGGVDVLPIGGLTKREVRALARHLRVPPAIVDRVPTAGLWPGQIDEEEMGLSYALLDAYLLGEAVPSDARVRIDRLHAASEHKRALPPIPDVPR